MRIISGTARGTKLYTLDGVNTRPTLDRVKEPLFNIINFELEDATVLDLFAGSGALGLEALSRGAKKAFFCEKNREAALVVEKNIIKTKFNDKSVLLNTDFEKAILQLQNLNEKINIVFIDPPYKTDFVKKSLNLLLNSNILCNDFIIIVETDEPDRILDDIKNININLYDNRKYGRVSLFFLNNEINK